MNTTDLATRQQNTDLAIRGDQSFWDEKQIAALAQLGVKDCTNGDLAVFFHQCARTGLDPFAKQIYMISRWTKDGPRQTIQTGIDGFRLIARRAADRDGGGLEYADTLWCGDDGIWHDVWIVNRPPAAAKVTVLRAGRRFSAVAVWTEYVQTVKSGAPNSMWERMPSNQLAKCAEAAALRKAFPQDLSGMYTDDEMGQTDRPAQDRPQQQRVTVADLDDQDPEPPIDGNVEPITPGQLQKLSILLDENELGDPAAGRAYCSTVLGRPVDSKKGLTKTEASTLIESFEPAATPPAAGGAA